MRQALESRFTSFDEQSRLYHHSTGATRHPAAASRPRVRRPKVDERALPDTPVQGDAFDRADLTARQLRPFRPA